MLNIQLLQRIDLRFIGVILCLLTISILVISSHTSDHSIDGDDVFLTSSVLHQLQGLCIGWVVFFFFAAFDYNKLREWTWILYAIMIVSLVGLFFTDSIQRVHRWYRIPFINISFQPSEYAKLAVVISLSWFLERRKDQSNSWSTVFYSLLIVGIPFVLILKQPDLGTALVLGPIALVMFYYGNLRPGVIKCMTWSIGLALIIVALFFLGIIPHEEMRPYATKVLKEYQYNRLNPNTHHQKASVTAIAVGGLTGTGWKNSEYAGGGWLPTPYTDSVFAAYGEEFGFIGMFLLMVLFYALIYFSFQVSAVAKDHFGRLLSAGISVYLAMHILVNVGMMCGFLPITGVPLILVSYGSSSVILTMAALGILQSIYCRRFMF